MSHTRFVQILAEKLPSSSNSNRDVWAKKIVEEHIPISVILPLLDLDYKIASRTLWLFTQIAMVDPSYLRPHLWTIYERFKANTIKGGEASIANQWLICGIPEDQEGQAVDVLFSWLSSSQMNETTKLRSRKALEKIAVKYPEIKSELKLFSENYEG